MVDASVMAALDTAVANDPQNAALRVHLASLLVMSGDPRRALEHVQVALAIVPDDPEALMVAQDAARAAGDTERADGYGRLVNALTPRPTSEPLERVSVDPERPPAASDEDEVERPSLRLSDVGGLVTVKARLDEAFLGPLRNPDLRDYYGQSLRGGLLLYGPPGCGKTFLARALAGELGAGFFSLGLNDVLNLWLGESERRLHEAFEIVRRAAPCVLFLDEIDALGRKRTQLRQSAGRNVVNQLLAELDGVLADNDGVFVLAATNHPWDVDTALRRPGRLDRTVLVLPPDLPARVEILERALGDRPFEGIDVAKLAKRTDGYSGADLVHLVSAATEKALAQSVRTGQINPVRQHEFDLALAELSDSTRGWFSIAHGYAVYANSGGEYDDLLRYIREKKLL